MLEKIRETFRKKTMVSSTPNIRHPLTLIDAIKRDHDDLKEMVEILQDDEISFTEKKKVLTDFSALLESHSLSETKAVYTVCLESDDIKSQALEAIEEHELCAVLLAKIRGSKNRAQWTARVKVLANLVELHISNEERYFLPLLEDFLVELNEKKMLTLFLELRQKTQKRVFQENAGVLQNLQI